MRKTTVSQENEREVIKLRKQLAAAVKELEEFSYVVSHDLRAPLRGIHSLVQWLEEDYCNTLEPKAKEYLDKLMLRTKKMNYMLEGILQYSRLGRCSLTPVHFDSCKETGLLIKKMTPSSQLTVTAAPDLPVIHYDRRLFNLIMENLLDNACKYRINPIGGVWVTCRQSIAADETDCWEYCVRDDGFGIAEKNHETIFKLFSTLQLSKDGASGLGLALARRAVRRCGGELRVVSEPGRGSSFYFTVTKQWAPISLESNTFAGE